MRKTILYTCLSAYFLWGIVGSLCSSFINYTTIIKWIIFIPLFIAISELRKKDVIYYLFISFGLLQSILVFLQHVDIIPSNHQLFEVTGFMGNPGQMGGFQTISLIFCLLIRKKRIKLFLVICTTLIAYTIIFSNSRAAWIASMCGIGMIYKHNISVFFKMHKLCFIPIAVFITGAIIILYAYRIESANARLLIWKVSSYIIADNPIIGVGPGRFKMVYMPYQAEYFASHPESDYRIVADNAAYPYNEFIHIAVEQGIIGLILLIALIIAFYINTSEKSRFAPIGSLLVFSIFSYPIDSLVLAISFPILFGILIDYKKSIHNKIIITICSLFVLAASATTYCISVDNNKIIKALIKKYDHETEMKLTSRLTYFYSNIRFNTMYMYIMEKNNKMIEEDKIKYIIPTCENWCVIGQLYLNNGNLGIAQKYFLQSSNMIPTRITPQYLLWRTYRLQGKYEKANCLAKDILSQPIKVENTTTLRMKHEISKTL